MIQLIEFFKNTDPITLILGAFGLLISIGTLLTILATFIRTIYEIITGK